MQCGANRVRHDRVKNPLGAVVGIERANRADQILRPPSRVPCFGPQKVSWDRRVSSRTSINVALCVWFHLFAQGAWNFRPIEDLLVQGVAEP